MNNNDYASKINNIMDKAKEDVRTQIDRAYQQGYEDAKSELGQNAIDLAHEENDRAYQQGLDDAWEAVQNITKDKDNGGYSGKMLMDLFGYLTIHEIVQRYAPQDVIRIIKEYEKQQKQDAEQVQDIQVGDEVVSVYGTKGVVVGMDIYEDEVWLSLLMRHHKVPQFVKASWVKTKTDRYFPQIAEVLAEMRGE